VVLVYFGCFTTLDFFLNLHLDRKMNIKEAAKEAILLFWARGLVSRSRKVTAPATGSRSSTTRERSWRRNCKRRSKAQTAQEAVFLDKLNDLFDIAHGNALKLITIDEDRD
jgi:hypothetical protein